MAKGSRPAPPPPPPPPVTANNLAGRGASARLRQKQAKAGLNFEDTILGAGLNFEDTILGGSFTGSNAASSSLLGPGG